MHKRIAVLSLLAAQVPGYCEAQPPVDPGMTNARLAELIQRVDPEVEGRQGLWRLRVANLEVLVITDQKQDRMRVMVPVRDAADLSADDLYRIMQANFDTALDARYAVAKGKLWSTFVHPLSTLGDEEFLLGLGQAVNLVTTYGSSYSSGVLMFGGGDSSEIRAQELLKELLERGLSI